MNKMFHCVIIEGNIKETCSEAEKFCIHILGDAFKDKIKRKTCSDVIWVECAKNKNSIGIDEIRRINRDTIIKPVECDCKIYIIKDAQNMTEQAQNAILKTIEEPSTGVYFILLCNNSEKLLDTVKSRSHVVKMFSEMHNKISDDHKLFIDYLTTKNCFGILKVLNEYCNKRENLKKFLEISKVHLIEQIKINNTGNRLKSLKNLDHCIGLLQYNLNSQLIIQYLCTN